MPSPLFTPTSVRSSTSPGTSTVDPISLAWSTSGSTKRPCSAPCKLAPNTVTQRLAALRFFYIQVLKRGWSAAETPYPKKVLHLPEILSQQEVARLIDATETPFQLRGR
jgi:site-specific recombinase XerD